MPINQGMQPGSGLGTGTLTSIQPQNPGVVQGAYNRNAMNASSITNLNNLNRDINQQNTNLQNNYNNAVQTNTGTYQDIMNRYNQMLGGGASYASGYGVSPNIGQARTTSGYTPVQGNPSNREDVNKWFQSIGVSDPNYWTDRAMEKGGVGTGEYWENFARSTGAIPGYSGGGGGGFGSITNYGSNFQMPDFSKEYGGYQNLANGGNAFSFDPEFRGALSNALAGYGEFSRTGGFSPQDIANIRARDIAPTRSIYAQGQAELNRNRALQGGYSPNFAASQAKMAREMSSQISDVNVNANAGIAQMVQQGKLAGLGGLSSTGAAGQGLQNNINSLNSQQIQAGLAGMTGIDSTIGNLGLGAGNLQLGYDQLNSGNQLKALAGMTDLYSATPGLSKMFGDQALQGTRNQIDAQGLQNQLDLGLGNQEIQRAQLPSGYQKALGNIASTASLIGQGAGALNALGITGGGAEAGATLGTGTSMVPSVVAPTAGAAVAPSTMAASAAAPIIAGTAASSLPAAGGITGASLGAGSAVNLGGSAAASGLGAGGNAGLAGGGSAAGLGAIAGFGAAAAAPYIFGHLINGGPMQAGQTNPMDTYAYLVATLGQATVDQAIATGQQENFGLPAGWRP